MYDTPVVCFLVALFGGIIMVMLSRLTQTRVVTVYKYLPRDLDSYLRESPYASISQDRVFAADDWTVVKAVHGTDPATVSGATPPPLPLVAKSRPPPPRTAGLFAGMSHTTLPT